MTHVTTLVFYLGKSKTQNAIHPPSLICDHVGMIGRSLQRDLLKSPAGFRAKIGMEEFPSVDLEWLAVGQTCGVGFWLRGPVVAASVLFNGLELDGEMAALRQCFVARELQASEKTWQEMATHEHRPLHGLLCFNLHSLTDPVLATVAPSLANAYFKTFGTNESPADEPPAWQPGA